MGITLTEKQTEAIEVLEDNKTVELIFGGGAGGAKSFLGAYWIVRNCLKYPESRWLVGRKELRSLRNSTLKSIFEVCKLQGLVKDVHYVYREHMNEINFPNGSQILLFALQYEPSDPEYDSLGSMELTGAFVDEVNQLPHIAWEVLRTRIRYKLDEYGLTPTMLGTCNPSKGWVYELFYKPSKEGKMEEGKHFIQALLKDNPNAESSYLKLLETSTKERRDRLLYGIWEQDDANSLISYDNILNTFTNTHVASTDSNVRKYITADIARHGSDKAVIMIWRGFEVQHIYSYDVSDTDHLEREIMKFKTQHAVPNSNIIIDDDGVGGGVVDHIKGSVGFVNNSSPINKENYYNLKTQCYYKLAEMINANQIYISAEIMPKMREDIIAELEQVKSLDDGKDSKLKILPKEEVKKNIGRSPDYSDALMMRMHYEMAPKRNTRVW